MDTAIWICQIVLALAFLYSGIMKISQSKERLMSIGQTGVAAFSLPAIRLIAMLELFGVVGVILPWRMGVVPWLSVVAALGFAVIMLLAAPIHYKREEPQSVALNLFLLLTSLATGYLMYRSL